jgi:exopolysaccharide biosynthesis WecB/TagA/CpsF family protein
MIGEGALRCEFLGMMFDRWSAASVGARVADLANGQSFSYVVTPNVDHIVQLFRSQDPAHIGSYERATLCVCDSRILQRLASWSGLDLPLVRGSDLTRDLLEDVLLSGKIAVVGGDAQFHHDIAKRYPRFAWQFHQPPMGVRHNAKARTDIAEFVEASGADVIFFVIGAPQSELVCSEILERGRARGVALCVGASLAFLTGAKRRAPLWMQGASLEWLFRLATEPRRLWRRYLVDGPEIFLIWRRWQRERSARLTAASGSSLSGYE